MEKWTEERVREWVNGLQVDERNHNEMMKVIEENQVNQKCSFVTLIRGRRQNEGDEEEGMC